jgi:hypothetical protein
VNVYGSDSFAVPSGSSTFSSSNVNPNAPPKPIKTIGNLTTAISTLRFNHDAQVLAVASKEKKDAMRLVSFVIRLPVFRCFCSFVAIYLSLNVSGLKISRIFKSLSFL